MTSREQRLPHPLPTVFALDRGVDGPDVSQQGVAAEPAKMPAGQAHQLNGSTSCCRLPVVALLSSCCWSSRWLPVVNVQNVNIEFRSIARKSLIYKVLGYKFAM